MFSIGEMIGQMIMIGLEGEELTQEERRLLREYPVGGFILFTRNLSGPDQILSLCRSLWEVKGDLPPFIAIDHEGGRVLRLPPPFTHFPPAALLGKTGSPEIAFRAGAAMARELAAVGVNLNFAPVLDVHSNPQNPVIGDRSFSSDPQDVKRLGWSMVRGLRTGGIIPCGKHFPGHGDTAQDSHLELPVVKKNRAELEKTGLLPFIHACRNHIESLMTAHVLYPSFDAERPATLSRAIITGLLRGKLGYEGVVFSDDLEMKAISEHYSIEEAAGLGVSAGLDVFLFCHDRRSSIRAFEFLRREAERRLAVKERVGESTERVKKLKERTLTSFTGVSEREVGSFVGLAEHRRLAEQIQGYL